MKYTIIFIAFTCLTFASADVASAQEDAPGILPGNQQYSPYPSQDFPNQVFFGDTHLHTSYSPDAGMIGCTLGPTEAYRFARGETVKSSTGIPARLSRPLDFLVVADHAESIGAGPAIQRGDAVIMESELGKELHRLVSQGTTEGAAAAFDLWLKAGSEGKNDMAGNLDLIGPSWASIAETADKFNTPGHFTAFIGYEWSSHPGGSNLHRVVVLRDSAKEAKQVIPISRDDSLDPEDVWKWMAEYEKKTGGRVLAIPHNGNLSNVVQRNDV